MQSYKLFPLSPYQCCIHVTRISCSRSPGNTIFFFFLLSLKSILSTCRRIANRCAYERRLQDNLCHIPNGTFPMKKLTVKLYILQKLVFIVQVLQVFFDKWSWLCFEIGQTNTVFQPPSGVIAKPHSIHQIPASETFPEFSVTFQIPWGVICRYWTVTCAFRTSAWVYLDSFCQRIEKSGGEINSTSLRYSSPGLNVTGFALYWLHVDTFALLLLLLMLSFEHTKTNYFSKNL